MTEGRGSGLRLLDIDDAASGLLAYSIERGEMDDAALDAIWQRFEEAKAAGTKVRIYAEMSGFPSVSASMIIDKLKRLGIILSTLERMAIVGDAAWLDFYAKIADPITKPDIKHFTTEQREKALAWLRA